MNKTAPIWILYAQIIYFFFLISCSSSETKLLKSCKVCGIVVYFVFQVIIFIAITFHEYLYKCTIWVFYISGVMSDKELICPWSVLSVLVPSFTQRKSRFYLVFLLTKIPLSTSFEILSLNSASSKFVEFLVAYPDEWLFIVLLLLSVRFRPSDSFLGVKAFLFMLIVISSTKTLK